MRDGKWIQTFGTIFELLTICPIQSLEFALTKRGGLVQHRDDPKHTAKFTGGCQ